MTATVRVTRTDHTPAELRELAAKSRDAAQTRRLLAIASVLDGSNRSDAARQAGMDRQTLRDEVARRFNVMVGERAIGKCLRKLELIRLQPRPYHPKKAPAAAEAFKKTSVHC